MQAHKGWHSLGLGDWSDGVGSLHLWPVRTDPIAGEVSLLFRCASHLLPARERYLGIDVCLLKQLDSARDFDARDSQTRGVGGTNMRQLRVRFTSDTGPMPGVRTEDG